MVVAAAATAISSSIAQGSADFPLAVQVDRVTLTSDTVQLAESKLRKLSPLAHSEPLHIEREAVVRISIAGQSVVVAPFVGTVQLAPYDRVTRCFVAILNDAVEPAIISRANTGFADDYEPCDSVKSVSILDVNADGFPDIVYRTTMTDARHRHYMVLDAYLVRQNLGVCFSPSVSTRLTVGYLRQWRVDPSASLRQQIRGDLKLKGLKCPSED